MTRQQTRLIERLGVALSYADEHSESFAGWKTEAVGNKIECLIKLMECVDRRQAGKI